MKRAVRYVIGEAVFWFHLAFIICAVFSGLALPFALVVAAIIAHRLHMIVFGGCVLTEVERRVGMLPHDRNYLQHAAHRLLGRTISLRQSLHLEYGFSAACFTIATARLAFQLAK